MNSNNSTASGQDSKKNQMIQLIVSTRIRDGDAEGEIKMKKGMINLRIK